MKPRDYFDISLKCRDIEEFKTVCPEGYDFVITNNLTEEWFDDRDIPMTVERAIEISHTCEGRHEFKSKHPRAHSVLKVNKLLSTLTWLKNDSTLKFKTSEILEIMSRYKSVSEFKENEPAVYNAANKRKLSKDYPWPEKKVPNKPRKWTKQELLDLIQENGYKYKSDLKKNGSAYYAALKLGIIDELGLVPHEKKWTPEKIIELASHYNKRSDFYTLEQEAYEAARHYGILEEVMSHMPKYHVKEYTKNEKYVIYLYADKENKVAYVGLTKNLKQRHYQHTKPHCRGGKYDNMALYFINNNMPIPEPEILYSDLCPEDASRMEINTYHEYVNNGWTMLNEEKELGSLGGRNKKWSFDKVKELSSSFEYYHDFRHVFPQAYHAAQTNKWLSDLNLKYINKPKGYWTPERIIEVSKDFDNLVDFRKAYPGLYSTGLSLNLDFSHLNKKEIHQKGYWTDERIISEAKMCTTLKEFRIEHKKAYDYSLKRGLFETFTWLKRAFDYLDLETVTDLARQCKSWGELRKLNQNAVAWAQKNNVDFPWFKPMRKRNMKKKKLENNEEDD